MSVLNENMKLSDVFDELLSCQDDVPIFRRLISIAHSRYSLLANENTREWEPILKHIVQIISGTSESANERVLLASHAFHSLLSARPDSSFLLDVVILFQRLESRDLCFLEERYVVSDVVLFKLLNAHGYLQVNRKDMYHDHVLSTMFDIIHRNCTKYTRYSYFAYKVLHVWLKRTTDTRFWHRSDIVLEQKLEAVLFSNWSNAFNDVPKQNAQLFNVYLRIMSEKYNGFLKHIFDTCDKYISWQDETRFTILAEVLRLWDNVETMMENLTQDFLYNLFNTLTYKSLRCAVTKVYMVILRKLSESEWREVFGETVKTIIEHWESGDYEDFDALHSLLKYWLDPTIDTHKDTFTFLWELRTESQDCYFHSHLLMTAARLNILLPQMCDIDRYINDRREITRMNAFAALCYRDRPDKIFGDNQTNPFIQIKRFLWFNANVSSVLMREHIVKYFKILYSNILRTIYARAKCARSIREFTKWLHEFFMDCFEIGSCYQRKILALKLYTALLSFTRRDSYKNCDYGEYLRNIATIDKYLIVTDNWRFTNEESLSALLRLVLDSTLDIRQLATDLILKYFKKDILPDADKVIYACGMQRCNSCKFYEVESGAAFMKILAHWSSSDKINGLEDSTAIFSGDEFNDIVNLKRASLNYSTVLLCLARQQLTLMKSDILKAVAENRPFYGMLTALLAITFRAGPESRSSSTDPEFTGEVLNLSKDAADFFLSTLFMKQSNTVYSSSFAEMGLAIDEHIRISEIDDCNYGKLQLSPAHQVLISCIWMSLKVLCEIASEIGMLMQSEEMVKSSMDIIVMVLLKCRHKGVVESAGVAIANLSRRLYDRKEYCELPQTYLTSLLGEAMEGEELLHLTRRGAGLSIMFHKLVVSDNRRDRPMVHFMVQKLLRSLENFSLVEIREVQSDSSGLLQDSPWARRLYFLCTLVADKEIHASLIPYIEEICLRCFDCIESDVWTVRNASLQLYGAVVPRLVGQCSGNKKDGSLDFADGYSLNHFITHYPKLAGRMLMQLQSASKITGTSDAALRSYAKVAHTLALLSRMWTGGCDLVDYPSSALIQHFRKPLYELCEKPMIHIRQLAAKAYVALTPSTCLGSTLDTIQRIIRESDNDNRSYGLFLIVGHLVDRLIRDTLASSRPHVPKETRTSDLYAHFCQRYRNVLTAWRDMCKDEGYYKQPCYMLETLFFEMMQADGDMNFLPDEHDDIWATIGRITPSQKIQPGFFQFLSLRARHCALHMKNSIPEIARSVLDANCTEQSIGFLNGTSHSVSLLEFILTYVTSMRDDHDPLLLAHMARLVRGIMKNDDLFDDEEPKLDSLARKFRRIAADTVATNPNVVYMKNALILAFSDQEMLINETLSHVLSLSTDDEQSVRLAATDYLEFAFRRFAQLTDDSRLTLMKCCLILLKDEVTEIRDVVSTLLQKYAIHQRIRSEPPRQLQHAEIVYQRFLEDVVCQLLTDQSLTVDDALNNKVANIVLYFTRGIKNSTDSNVTIENPFYHDDATFYKEESKFLNLCYLYGKLRIIDESPCANKNNCCDVARAVEVSREFRKKITCNYDLKTFLCIKEMDYLIRKRDFLLQCLLVSPIVHLSLS
ncbi:Thyroid adenoma-associated protein [Harpegnathos saltator]|uniref:Thyroid adenoma-associated protein n=1 Tax=Harpegnathos saltator TaxID=610380 RepID=E2BWA2_HARSA|nr:Thyroid adenoma-associated protein [Harpegnathos saltator]